MENGYEIAWSDRSLLHLDQILLYLQTEWSDKEVRSFALKLEKVLKLISHNPLLFPLSGHSGLRKCVLSKHTSIYYRIRSESVHIIGLFDNRKDPQKLDTDI